MKILKKLLVIALMALAFIGLFACASQSHDPNEVKTQGSWSTVSAKYNEITLNWEESYFVNDDFTIDIPNDWYVGFQQR